MGINEKSLKEPTVEFYEGNAIAEDIRNACIPIVRKIHKLLNDPTISNDVGTRSFLYAQLELDNGKLIELGIEPNIEMGKSLEEYWTKPLVSARYLAGQLIKLTGETLPAVSEFNGTVGENAITLDDGIQMVDSLDAAPKTLDFSVIQTILTFVQNGLAIDNTDLEIGES